MTFSISSHLLKTQVHKVLKCYVSNFLHSNLYIRFFFRNGKPKLLSLYLRRYLRIVPVLAFAVVFHMSLLKFVTAGPRNSIIDRQRGYCEASVWTVLLLISNYVDPTLVCSCRCTEAWFRFLYIAAIFSVSHTLGTWMSISNCSYSRHFWWCWCSATKNDSPLFQSAWFLWISYW